MEGMRRVHVLVEGDVQGVGYRYTMKIVAHEAGVVGWVRNLRDGRVEAEFEGDDDAVDEVLAWMAQGPPGSRVDTAHVAEAAPRGGAAELSFEVLSSA
jgi:acylphosphatase